MDEGGASSAASAGWRRVWESAHATLVAPTKVALSAMVSRPVQVGVNGTPVGAFKFQQAFLIDSMTETCFFLNSDVAELSALLSVAMLAKVVA